MSTEMRSVLVVDDEPFIRQSFVDFFEDRLWQALPAESGEEALEAVRRESPQCAIVDIRLGGMDGDAFIREAVKMNPKMAFVICTGSPEYGVPADLLALPSVCNHIYLKPVTNIAELEQGLLQMMDTLNAGSG